jgi:lipoic acid synthetase
MSNPQHERPARQSRPSWLKITPPSGENYKEVKNLMSGHKLHTVCQEAKCPNLSECWASKTATFLILGDICNRACRFCAVKTGKPIVPDESEPDNVAQTVKSMELKHVVITSVTRDDLKDGGAEHWAKVIARTKEVNPGITMEVLIPDFQGDKEALYTVLAAEPDVLNHNVETVPRLYQRVRPKADFHQSLNVLRWAKEKGFRTKTGIMVGLGETKEEVIEAMREIRNANVDIMTIGQYLQPTKDHLPVEEYVSLRRFDEYKEIGLEMGFDIVESAPLVRSSYHAHKHL